MELYLHSPFFTTSHENSSNGSEVETVQFYVLLLVPKEDTCDYKMRRQMIFKGNGMKISLSVVTECEEICNSSG